MVESKYARKKRLQNMQVAEYNRGEHDEMIREYDERNRYEHEPIRDDQMADYKRANPKRYGFLGRRRKP